MAFTADSTSQDFNSFLERYPKYSDTTILDSLRASEYSRLDTHGHVYLDYTGGGLYADKQLREHFKLLRENVYGNPHSLNPSSVPMTNQIEETRHSILAFFNADELEYDVIFTPNATGALKLVGESYPFGPTSQVCLSSDNHNSVNGIREYAYAVHSQVHYIALDPATLSLDLQHLNGLLASLNLEGNNLLAFPAQSNFSGVKHPLHIIEQAHRYGWDVLLDAAAFVPSNILDLNIVHPDFVSISFYKMFGYPTGVGCLLARKQALKKLQRKWYAGGTTAFSSVGASTGFSSGHYFLPSPSRFEDGTLNYLSIPAVRIGLDLLRSVGLPVIQERVLCLTEWLIEQLTVLKHANGNPLVRLYGPSGREGRGGTLLFNLLDRDGVIIGSDRVITAANRYKISLRTGCHCNPGAREAALGMEKGELVACLHDKDTLEMDAFLKQIEGQTTGGIRVSLGIVSNFADVRTLLVMLTEFIS